MSKLFGYGEGLEAKTTEIANKCENFVDLAFKASGISVMDMLGLNAETNAAIGGFIELYKGLKELVEMQAKAMDKMLGDFDELKGVNENLRKQNEMLQQMLQDLNRKVEKIGE